jgi:hypothetical protein
MIAKVARATTSPVKARKRFGMNAPANARIRQMATTQGRIKVQMMRETRSIFMRHP